MDYEKLLGKTVKYSKGGIFLVGGISDDSITICGVMNGFSRNSTCSADFNKFDEIFKFVDENDQKIWNDFKEMQ